MRKWIAPSIVLASLIITAVVYPNLPVRMPTHWNLAGEVDGWGTRPWAAWTIPLTLIALWGMMRWLPSIDPRRENYAKFTGAFEGIMILVMLFVFGLQMVLLAAGLGKPVAMDRIAPLGIGLLLIGIGNLLPRARSNWFVGIRTPWTLSSDRVWERTHRIGGYVFVIAGALTVLAALMTPRWAYIVMSVACGAAGLGVLVYSYVAWRQDQTLSPPDVGAFPPGSST